MGVNPKPFSLRELVWMAEARQIDQWNHTTSIIGVLIKVNSGKRTNLDIAKLHPFASKLKKARRKLSKQESYERLNAMVGMYGRDTFNAADSAGKMEPSRFGGDTDSS